MMNRISIGATLSLSLFLFGAPLWADMNNAQRFASFTSDPNLVWTGPQVTASLPGITSLTSAPVRVRTELVAALATPKSASLIAPS